MASNIEEELERMLQAILINTGYPCPSDNLDFLISDEFYLDVCRNIFPELNIKIMTIKQNQDLTPEDKIQKLIDLLSHQLQLDLSSIKGQEIINGHFLHLHKFLQVLEKFTQYHQTHSQDGSGSSRRVRSDPNNSQRGKGGEYNVPRSAREKINQQMLELDDEPLPEKPQRNIKKNSIARKPVYSAAKKQKRNKTQAKKNMYQSLVKIMMVEKNRAMSASKRDNRKVKNQQIIDAKNRYKAYLLNFAKQNKAAKNRQNILRENLAHKKSEVNVLPLQDLNNVSGLFKSFEYKLRDQKYCYLKRVQKLIKTQEVDRMCYFNKIEKDRNQQVKKSTKKEVERINNEHKIRNDLLKETYVNVKQQKKIMKKQYDKFLRKQKSELKENKKRQIQKIKDFMQQENEKVLVNLSEGGRLEKIIMDMYKKF